MKIFTSHKRSRVARKSPHRPAHHVVTQFFSLKYHRGRLLRLMIGLVGAIAIVTSLQSWVHPFTYRIGDRCPDGVVARMTFQVTNSFETARLAKERERLVPLIFRNNPEPLRMVPQQLKAALGAVAEADTLADLNPEVRQAFGLVQAPAPAETPPGPAQPEQPATDQSQDVRFRFEQLKQAITPLDAQQFDTHISSIIDEFTRFLHPIIKTGILDPRDLERRELSLDSTLAIVDADVDLPRPNPLDNTEVWNPATITDVSLSDLLNDAGLLSQRWSDYARLEPIRRSLERWMRNTVRPTLEYDQAMTQTARRWAGQQVEPVYDLINEGDELVPPGELVDQSRLNILLAEYEAFLEVFPAEARLGRLSIVFLMVSVLLLISSWYWRRFEPVVVNSWARLSVYLAVIAIAAFVGRLSSFDPVRGEIAVVVATTMIISIAYNQRLAIVTAFLLSLLITMATRINVSQFTVMLAAATAAVICLQRVQSRSTIIIAGFVSGLTTLIVSWGMTVLIYPSDSPYIWFDLVQLQLCLKYAGWCVLAGFILAGSLPFIESTFGVVTGISLLEMSDPSHPLLQELVRKAPGTYNHSMALATIAEAAAKTIGADGLLVRVGAYFHDVGKIPKAEYFIENRAAGAVNRHDTLAPAMSTLIIIGHVKDGVDLAEEYHLPQVLIDFIEQHHGTTLVEYFYHAANKKADAEPERKNDVEEAAFRYPGPKPQTREAGILMLADCVESASRTLSEPTPARIRTLVHQLTMKRLLDGQFDECALKLSEIHQIEESLIKSLISMHHGRIVYPESQKEQKSA